MIRKPKAGIFEIADLIITPEIPISLYGNIM